MARMKRPRLAAIEVLAESRMRLAQALGMTSRTISAYGTGARLVPRYIALACKGWEVAQRR